MPIIKSSTDLRNNYNDISSFCNETGEPVFVTKNGRGDLAVMSIDSYNNLIARYELYHLLEESETDLKNGRSMTLEDSMKNIKEALTNGNL
jgi:prevent-host-death family protein